jgi:hypothetical protein
MSLPLKDFRLGSISESTGTHCGLCGAPIVAVLVQTDHGGTWGAVELWCGSYRAHQCPEAEMEGVAA